MFKNKSFSVLFLFLTAAALSFFFNNCSAPMNSQNTVNQSSSTSQASSATFSGKAAAEILLISNSGSVWGYARDTANSNLILNARFYVDGPAGNGRFAGEIWANQKSSGPNAGHFFTFQLPAEFVDGLTHTLYMYVVEDRAANLLPTMSFAGYTPKAEAVFNNYINGFVQSNCTRCHQTFWNYQTLFSGPLLKPTPAAGGTATNNILINRMVGSVAHSGGKFCPNGLSDPLCVEIQRWWNAEFAQSN